MLSDDSEFGPKNAWHSKGSRMVSKKYPNVLTFYPIYKYTVFIYKYTVFIYKYTVLQCVSVE